LTFSRFFDKINKYLIKIFMFRPESGGNFEEEVLKSEGNVPEGEKLGTKESGDLPGDFGDKVENLQFQKEKQRMAFAETVDEIRDMAKGGNAGGIREQFYAGWSDDHFRKLLEAAGETAGQDQTGAVAKPAAKKETAGLERVEDPKDEYGDMQILSMVENFGDNLDKVDEQLARIRIALEGGGMAAAGRLLTNFEINGKSIDLTKISEGGFVDNYNDLLFERNKIVEDAGLGREKGILIEMQ
jgi:hypothetical protein